jgi:hypothetical protein
VTTKRWYQRDDEKLTIPPKVECGFGSLDELQTRGVKLAVVQVLGCDPELAVYIDGHAFGVQLTEFRLGQPIPVSRPDRIRTTGGENVPQLVYRGGQWFGRTSHTHAPGQHLCLSAPCLP